MVYWTALAFAFAFFVAGPAQGQTKEEAGRLIDFVEAETKALSGSIENLINMAHGLRDSEYEAAQNIMHALILTSDSRFDVVTKFAIVYESMLDPRDASIVRKFLETEAIGTRRSADLTLRIVNTNLVRLRSTALIAEVQKARDQVIKVRDEIQRVIPTGRGK